MKYAISSTPGIYFTYPLTVMYPPSLERNKCRIPWENRVPYPLLDRTYPRLHEVFRIPDVLPGLRFSTCHPCPFHGEQVAIYNRRSYIQVREKGGEKGGGKRKSSHC